MRFIKLKSWSHRQRWTRWASRLVSSFDSWGCVVVVHVSKTNHGQSLVTALCSDSACQQNKTKLRGSTRNAGRINPWFPNKSRGKPVQQRRTGLLLGGRGNGLGRHGQNPPPPPTDTQTYSLCHTHTHQHRLHNMQVLDLRRLGFWQRASKHGLCVQSKVSRFKDLWRPFTSQGCCYPREARLFVFWPALPSDSPSINLRIPRIG